MDAQHAIEAWGGREPRGWQAEALPLVLRGINSGEAVIVSAVMGSGKSVLIAEVCASGRGRVVVTVPTIALVEQLAATIGARCPGEVGAYYTSRKDVAARIVVVCIASLPAYVEAAEHLGPPALWIADECHKTEARTVLESHALLRPVRSLGFTATPFRSDEHEDLSLWSKVVYSYGVKEASRDGVIVPFVLEYWTGERMPLDEACVQMIERALPRGPGLVNARDIGDAEAFAARLTHANIRAAAVHSRMPAQAVAGRIEALRTGALDVLVHVNLLTEGVDLPWLRWLCLRRAVRSAVRFCQEVGRVLRAHPGKDRAWILDPNDLFLQFGLTHDAVLAGDAIERNARDTDLDDARDDPYDADSEQGKERWARRIATWRRYLRRLYLVACTLDLIPDAVAAGRWCSKPPSDKQLAAVGRTLAGLSRDTTIPMPHRRQMGQIAENATRMQRGDIANLMSLAILFGNGRRTKSEVWARLALALDEEEQ